MQKSGLRSAIIRRLWWLLSGLLVAAAGTASILVLVNVRSDTLIKNAPQQTFVVAPSSTQQYQEAGFTINLPTGWTATAKPVPGSPSYSWQSGAVADQGQSLFVYEDNLPVSFPVSRVVVVSAASNHLLVTPQTSPDCNSFAGPVQSDTTISRWHGAAFICDRRPQAAEVTALASSTAINSVTLQSPTSGARHRFFVTYINYDANPPDYAVFYNALASLRLQ